MKKTVISLVLLLIAVCCWAQKVWENPMSFFDGGDFSMKVTKVDFLNEETVVHLSVKTLPRNSYGFAKESYLITPDGKHYSIKSGKATCDGETDYILGEFLKHTSVNTNFALHFEPLPADVERFHFTEGPIDGAFKIWNITETKPKEMSGLFNSNWRDDQTGDWVLGLYADNAVYDSKVWKYEEKSDKKVVLSNGQEKTTINIGKEKNGKRQFTINEQKVTLSSFGSVLPAYPIADNTAFTPELVNDEATIVGWIKDFPKDIFDKGLTVSANVIDLVTDRNVIVKVPASYENGQFAMKVKLNGAQRVVYGEVAGNDRVFIKELVLEPGKKYYMVHDWKNGSCLFMGENARLQNELATNACDYESNEFVRYLQGDEAIAFRDLCKANYDKAANLIAKNPNISKRYRDYINEKNRVAAACDMLYSIAGLIDDVTDVSDKLCAFNPALPISLVPDFSSYQFGRFLLINEKVREKYIEMPELYISFEEKGLLKLNESERDLLKKWQQVIILGKRANEKARNEAENKAVTERPKISYGEVMDFIGKPHIKKVYDDWAPKPYQTERYVIDSLYSDQIMRDYIRARMIAYDLSRNGSLKKEAAIVINEIRNNRLRQQAAALKNQNDELTRRNEEAVNRVIAPSSNVEGLTDGKAILDKIIEPYKGKIVFMDIWGTWCLPCKNAIKASPKLKEAVKDYDIVYLYFASKSEESAWKNDIAELGLTKPNCVHYNLPRKQQDAVFKYLKVDILPSYFLFDKQGNIETLDNWHMNDIEGFKKKVDELSKK